MELTANSPSVLPVEVGILSISPHVTRRTTNSIQTSKYNVFSFLPLCLYDLLHPFRHFANFFYLLVGTLQFIPPISPNGGTPTAWGSLVVILFVDLVIAGRDDYNRHKADTVTNAQPVDIFRVGKALATPSRAEDTSTSAQKLSLHRATWADVRTGDVVRVHRGEAFPADLLLLRGSDPPGQCWVNTKPLDGESDMKLRLVPKGVADLRFENPEQYCSSLKGTVRCEVGVTPTLGSLSSNYEDTCSAHFLATHSALNSTFPGRRRQTGR